jgi:transposase-like protein
MVELKKFTNLIELVTYFKDEKVCIKYLEKIRWEDRNYTCPYDGCNHNKVFKYSNGKTYKCSKCQKQFSIRVGTIFEDSKISLKKWFAAIYLVTSHKKGISSLQLSKDVGVTQKTAWFMLHRIRKALGLHQSDDKLDGICEADETYIGGQEKNKHWNKKVKGTQGRSLKTKTIVAGVIERGGELRAKKLESTNVVTLGKFISDNVAEGSRVNTDEWLGYRKLHKMFDHRVVNHKSHQYVEGDVHTNTLEGFWALFKRGIRGVYHLMSAKHMQMYVDEFVFRYNTRDFSEYHRFNTMLDRVNVRPKYCDLVK